MKKIIKFFKDLKERRQIEKEIHEELDKFQESLRK